MRRKSRLPYFNQTSGYINIVSCLSELCHCLVRFTEEFHRGLKIGNHLQSLHLVWNIMISSTSSRRINHAYLSELRELVDLLDRVMDVMTAVTKVDYCSHFLVYGFATFFGISGAV
jgi:hypothetical protein